MVSTTAVGGHALLCDIQVWPLEAKLGLAVVEKRKWGREGSRDSYRVAKLMIRENRDLDAVDFQRRSSAPAWCEEDSDERLTVGPGVSAGEGEGPFVSQT